MASAEVHSGPVAWPIVIFGAPRSGTTYLQAILNEHPEVFITNESRIFAWMHETINVLTARHDLLVACQDEFRAYLKETIPGLVRDFYARVSSNSQFWGDKNPHYADQRHIGCLDLINEVFPGARFVHLIRDGRDVVTSLCQQRAPDGTPWIDFEGAHFVWTQIVETGRDFGVALGDGRYMEIRYEELIADDVGTMRAIFTQMGVPWDEKVEGFCHEQRKERTPFSRPTRDLDKDGAAASEWARVFSAAERRRSLELLGGSLVRYGYETDESLREALRGLDDRDEVRLEPPWDSEAGADVATPDHE